MKAKIYYFLILGLLFWHPRHALAIEAKQSSLPGHSFQKTPQERLAFSGDSQNLHAFFSVDIDIDNDVAADVDVDDDDDVSFSARKRVSFDTTARFDSNQYIFEDFYNISFSKYSTPYFYHLSPSHFISLRVFRL
jgi:hypothetical protein